MRDIYKDAGVDTQKGDDLVTWLQNKNASKNKLGKVVSGIGGFAALYKPKFKKFKKPLLIASTDGVGTKLLLGLQHNKLLGLGEDLVAMCVNDLYTVGGQPLFFLDYYATGKLDEKQFQNILSGIKSGCNKAEMSLIGGETAELPGLYAHGHFDLAGFVVGIVDEKKLLGPKQVKKGDKLFAIASSGFHSNGYSLIRKWLGNKKIAPTLISQLLTPTHIYSQTPQLFPHMHALANITGGGISGNLPRVIANGLDAHISKSAIKTPKWMLDFIHDNDASFDDVEQVFNLGVGMIAVVDEKVDFAKFAKKAGLVSYEIGEIKSQKKSKKESTVIYAN